MKTAHFSTAVPYILTKIEAISENEKINVNVSCKIGVQCICIANDTILFSTSPKDIGHNDAEVLKSSRKRHKRSFTIKRVEVQRTGSAVAQWSINSSSKLGSQVQFPLRKITVTFHHLSLISQSIIVFQP